MVGTSCRARAANRYAAMGGARDIDSKRLFRRSGTRAFCTVPLQCHPKQCADKHLRPSTARGDTVAFILPSKPAANPLSYWPSPIIRCAIQIHSAARRHTKSSTLAEILQFGRRANCSPTRQSTAVELLRACCKQCARPAMLTTIRPHCWRGQPHRLVVSECWLQFRISLNGGNITDVTPLRICAKALNRCRDSRCAGVPVGGVGSELRARL
jgi:hypothetical protein